RLQWEKWTYVRGLDWRTLFDRSAWRRGAIGRCACEPDYMGSVFRPRTQIKRGSGLSCGVLAARPVTGAVRPLPVRGASELVRISLYHCTGAFHLPVLDPLNRIPVTANLPAALGVGTILE